MYRKAAVSVESQKVTLKITKPTQRLLKKKDMSPRLRFKPNLILEDYEMCLITGLFLS